MNMQQALEELLAEIEGKQTQSPSASPTTLKAENEEFFGPFNNWHQQIGKPSGWSVSVSWPRLATLTRQAREALRAEGLKPEIGGYDPDLDIG